MIQKSDIKKYSTGWWLTFWSEDQVRRIATDGPYRTKDGADADREAINAKRKKFKKLHNVKQ